MIQHTGTMGYVYTYKIYFHIFIIDFNLIDYWLLEKYMRRGTIYFDFVEHSQ